MAILVPTNDGVDVWLRVLAERGIPAVSLRHYDGTGAEVVKVGTYHRAKSLDFAHVCIPDGNRFPEPRRPDESADAFSERTQLARRQLYVALARARDTLWIGLRTEPPHDRHAADRSYWREPRVIAPVATPVRERTRWRVSTRANQPVGRLSRGAN